MRLILRRTAPRLLLLVAAGMALSAAPQFSSAVDLVEVYATVTDARGAPVRDLRQDDFEVLEDGQPQRVAAFAAGDFPLSLAVAVDHSASMAGRRLRTVIDAARALIGALRPDDQVMVIGIASEVEVLAPLSTDRGAQLQALEGLQPWSTTPLYDSIIAGIDLVQRGRGRRALVVLSDGEDRYSRSAAPDVLARARRADVMVYPVALGKSAPALFPEIAALTGGRSFQLQDPARVQAALTGLARELRFQYLLGYTPARPAPARATGGDWHSIELKVRQPGLRVRARDGYYGR